MPFTVSHVAAVLPFSRPLSRWRLLSATIVGSMVPDFGLLLPVRPPRVETHSTLGLLTFCLPLGLLTFWIFQRLIKQAITEILPNGAYGRWQHSAAPADITNAKQWLLAASGVFIGAVTHLVWDAFTHEGARGVRMIPALDDPAVDIVGHHIIGTRLLQDVSSLMGLGLVLLLVVYGLRPARRGVARPVRRLGAVERYAWILAYVVMTAAVAGLFLTIRRPPSSTQSFALWVGTYAIAALRGCAAALLVVSLALTLRLRANRAGSRAT